MPWQIDGTFLRVNPDYSGNVWDKDQKADIKVIATRHDYHDADLASGIEKCLSTQGYNKMLADLNMNSFKIVNTAPGTGNGDPVSFEQLFDTMGFDDPSRTLTLSAPDGSSLTAVIPSGSGGGGEGTVTQITIGDGLTGTVNPITTSGEIAMPTVITAQSLGNGIGSITVDAYGRVTAVTGDFGGGGGGSLVFKDPPTRGSTYVRISDVNDINNKVDIPVASTSNAGVMSASDKVNMNNLLTLDIKGTYYTSYVELELDPLGSVFPLEYARSGRAGVLAGGDWDRFDDAASNNMDDWQVFQPTVAIGGGVFFTDNRGGQSPSIPNCSPIHDGLMSGDDKTKLDGLSAVVVAFAADLQGRGIITPAEEADLLAAFA